MKTKKTATSVADFLNSIPETQKREDCRAIAKMMQAATKAAPKMWGPSIVGFGHCRWVYPNGKEMDWMQIAFSRKGEHHALRHRRGTEIGFDGEAGQE
jgi:hypothetical protein